MILPIPIILFYVFVLSACLLYLGKYRVAAVASLIAALLAVGYWVIGLDPFLNDWDERYHALVAKNLSSNMLHPTLYKNPLLPYDYREWIQNHTWIHKQPLFLWIIAVSVKIFGAVEKSVRLPSVIMLGLLIPIAYRMAKKISNERTAFFLALLIGSNYTFLQNASGIFLVDHNNIAFLFFVTVSFACWIEFETAQKTRWLYLMGLAVGCAILVKWLVGLLVFAPFGVYHLFVKRDLVQSKLLFQALKSVAIVVAVAAPWQVYCYNNFQKEFLYEMAFNSKHLWEALEGHDGKWNYYFNKLPHDYTGVYWLIVPGLIAMIFVAHNRWLNRMIFLSVAIVYAFFSFTATKMPQYAIIAAPLIFYGIALLLDRVLTFTQISLLGGRKMASAVLFIAMSMMLVHGNLAYKQIEGWHWRNLAEETGRYKEYKAYCKVFFRNLKQTQNAEKSVVIFCPQNIDCMFYSDFIAYDWVEENELEILKGTGRKILVFNRSDLPEYVTADSTLTLLTNDLN